MNTSKLIEQVKRILDVHHNNAIAAERVVDFLFQAQVEPAGLVYALTESQAQALAAFGYDWAEESGLEENYPGCTLLSDAVPIFLANLAPAPLGQGVAVLLPNHEEVNP